MISPAVRDCTLNERFNVDPRNRTIRAHLKHTAKSDFTKVAADGLLRLGNRIWRFGRRSTQVVTSSRRLRSAASLIGVIFLLWTPTRATEFSDVTLRTGSQLKDRFARALENPNMRAALGYFAENGLKVDPDGLVDMSFRVDKAPDFDTLLFIPFYERTGEFRHVLVLAQTPKSSRVFLGTLSGDPKQPDVKEERVVVDGKIQPGQGQLKSFFKCAIVGCASAGPGCLVGGAAWLPCFCLWCGGAAIGCGAVELLVP
jgi:hypothetical protein